MRQQLITTSLLHTSQPGPGQRRPVVDDDLDEGAVGEYGLYGISLRSEIPLPYSRIRRGRTPDVTILKRERVWFDAVRDKTIDVDRSSGWYEYARLTDGSDFLRWPSLYEFLVSGDGKQVAARQLEAATCESFHSYLLGWVLSFALLKQWHEPLYATAIVVDGKAVALLGARGSGKSTLAACFVHAGHRLLTDDLLMIREVRGVLSAFPGPPRLKLYPHVAERFLPDKRSRGAMHPDSDKLLIPLGDDEVEQRPVPLHGFVFLDSGRAPVSGATLDKVDRLESLLQLCGATFNDRWRPADRLERQVRASTVWASRLPVWRARYLRLLDELPQVQQSIVHEIRRDAKATAAGSCADPQTHHSRARL